MAVGSAFDAYVKSYIAQVLKIEGWEFEELFEQQVEPQNRPDGRIAGAEVFSAYRTSGVLASLVATLDKSIHGTVRLESTLRGQISESELVLLGKPDLMFVLPCGRPVILDWKVNGYYSKASTKRCYRSVRDGKTDGGIYSKTHGTRHKDYYGKEICEGFDICVSENFEDYYPEHASQLATYLWLNGEAVGTDAVVVIHQIACSTASAGRSIRVAEYRGVIGASYQHALHVDYQECWDAIQSPATVFAELGEDGSMRKCEMLDAMAKQSAEGMEEDAVFERAWVEVTR
jgi:hypothetical protein